MKFLEKELVINQMEKLFQLEILNWFGLEENENTATIIYLKENDEIIGKIELEDIIKEEAKEAIRELNQNGIKTKMLTGDVKSVADKIGKEVGVQEIKSEMLPQDKYNEVEKIKEESNKIRKNSCLCG